MRRAVGFVAILAVPLGSCSDVSQEPLGLRSLGSAAADVTTTNVIFPVEIETFVPCAAGGAGEIVQLSGNIHDLFHVMINGNRFKVKIHTQPQGIRGVGLTTGDKYQGTGVTQETFGGSFVNGQESSTFVNNFRIIGQGPGNNFMIHELVHFTINARGEVTADVGRLRVTCR
ncbi:MAG TPA: hypothetical protein VFH11_02130 [Gemmatimonadota bacterium]|nr:hypothetical protein [Gemmatimonadota bacterium]